MGGLQDTGEVGENAYRSSDKIIIVVSVRDV